MQFCPVLAWLVPWCLCLVEPLPGHSILWCVSRIHTYYKNRQVGEVGRSGDGVWWVVRGGGWVGWAGIFGDVELIGKRWKP